MAPDGIDFLVIDSPKVRDDMTRGTHIKAVDMPCHPVMVSW